MSISYAELLAATGGKTGRVDVACPMCGPGARAEVNRKRRVLRVWDDGEFATFNCARCGTKGWAKPDASSASIPERPRAQPKPERDMAKVAEALWQRSSPLRGSLSETYLCSRSCFVESANLRFLPAHDRYCPAMIARFGTGTPTGIHLTRLREDGTGKAGGETDKLMIGPSVGLPIIVYDNPDRSELVVSEGIEDAATMALVAGWSAWAAGSWSRYGACGDRVV